MKKALVLIVLTITMAVGIIFPTASVHADTSTVVDVGSNYSLLPDTDGEYYRIINIQLYDVETNSYHFKFEVYNSASYDYVIYQFDVAIPDTINLNDYFNTDNGLINASYVMMDHEYQVIYLQPNLDLEPIPSGDGTEDNPLDVIDGFTTINLSDMTYSTVNKLQISSVINKESGSKAFMYSFMDPRIEDILSMSFTYNYQYIYPFGIQGTLKSTSILYIKGDQYEENPIPNQFINLQLVNRLFNLFGYSMTSFEDSIDKISIDDIPDTVMTIYTDDLDGSLSRLNTLNLYKIYLGDFSSTLTVDYNIQDVVITDLLYTYQGVVYEAGSEVIEHEIEYPDTVGWTWDAVLQWLVDNAQYIIPSIIGLVVLVVVSIIFKALGTIFAFIGKIIKAIFKLIGYIFLGIGYLIKYSAIAVWYIIKAVFFWIPKGIIKFIAFLFTPKSMRGKGTSYVSRHF